MAKTLLQRLSDISNIHKRAAFSDVLKYTSPKHSHFLTLAGKRYSCRSFSARPVSDTMVESILEAARLAPSAVNKQPVHIWVARSPESIAKLGETTKYLFGAPIVFVVGCKPSEAWVRKYDGKNGAEIDAAIVGTHIMMAAADLGLGSTWVGSFDPAALRSAFPAVADWEVVALFPVGHPAADAAPSANHEKRKPLDEFVSEL